MSRPDPRPRSAYGRFHFMTTRWSDNDAYGHINNSVHYLWFDSAVNAWMVERGLLDIHEGDPIALVAETGCRFLAPLAYPQKIEIGMRVASVGGSSIRWELGVFAEGSDEPASEGHFVHVVVGRNSRRPLPVPDRWREALSKLAG